MTISDWINSLLAIATVAMAGGTFYLAKITRDLTVDTANATKQADRHHRENLRPFCVIAFFKSSEQHPFGSEFDPESRRLGQLMAGTDQITPSSSIRVRGELQNKASGLAKDVLLYLNMRRGEGENDAYRLTRPLVVSGLIGAEEILTIDVGITERDIMPTWDGTTWKPIQIFSAVASDTYEVVLEYKDIFENTFRTTHPRGIWTEPTPSIGDQEKISEKMIRQDRPTPIFLAGRQAAHTPADLTCPSTTCTGVSLPPPKRPDMP